MLPVSPWCVLSRARHGTPRGRRNRARKGLPWPGSRRKPSPSGGPVPPGGCGCRGTPRRRRNLPRIRRPWAVSRRKPSPSDRFAASAGRPCRRSSRGRSPRSPGLPSSKRPAAPGIRRRATRSHLNSPDRNANLDAQQAELCDSDKSVFPNLLRPVQRGRQRSW